jgi:hypothetical protein
VERLESVKKALQLYAPARNFGARGWLIGDLFRFWSPAASAEVVQKLIELGYLQQVKRYKAGPVARALARLRQDLHRRGNIAPGDISCDFWHPAWAQTKVRYGAAIHHARYAVPAPLISVAQK